MYYFSSILICLMLMISCKGVPKTGEQTNVIISAESDINKVPKYVNSIQIVTPTKQDTLSFNQRLNIYYENNRRYSIDSAHIFLNNNYVTTLDSLTKRYSMEIPPGKCGINSIKVIAFHPGNRQGTATRSFIVKPDKMPKRLSFKILKTYSHDPDASTQGLVYHEGYMYEGTGIKGKSTLRKVDLENNKIISLLNLSSDLFGEGVTIYKDKILQITWTSGEGFVYDLKTFSLETTFDYTTQGWGITTMNDVLVMSDGTNQLYHLNPNGFNKIKTVEVYDNYGQVDQLNELEYIEGYIWANVWLTDRIVVIDPETGVVVADLYLPNMLTPAEKAKIDLKEDVLNGIAYNKEKGVIYVTGKHWPHIFELKVEPLY